MDKENEGDNKMIKLIVTKNANKEWSDNKSVCEMLKVVKRHLRSG